jgi:hypothetical protein
MRALQAKSDIVGSIYLILQYRILPHMTESKNLSPQRRAGVERVGRSQLGWRMPKGGRKNCGELRRAMFI